MCLFACADLKVTDRRPLQGALDDLAMALTIDFPPEVSLALCLF